MGLDEYSEAALLGELAARRTDRRYGICDYCHRPHGADPTCRYRDRHIGDVAESPTWYERFRDLNLARCEDDRGFGQAHATIDEWTPADWFMAVVGELGELGNLLKKQRRGEHVPHDLLADEWADTFTYLDLLARRLGIDPETAVMDKFHRVSKRIGWSPP